MAVPTKSIDVTIPGDGNSFKVNDAGTKDNKKCHSTWDELFGKMAEMDKSTFRYTDRYKNSRRLPLKKGALKR
jgi:hypothetical protein